MYYIASEWLNIVQAPKINVQQQLYYSTLIVSAECCLAALLWTSSDSGSVMGQKQHWCPLWTISEKSRMGDTIRELPIPLMRRHAADPIG